MVRQRLLAALSSEEQQRRELVRVFQIGTMLQFQGGWLSESSREHHPIDSTDQLCIIWELVLATQAGLDGYGLGGSAWLQGFCWCM